MLFATDATSLIQLLQVVDIAGEPITGIDYDDGDLLVSYKLQSGAAWVTPTLVEGTLGQYIENSWIEDSEGNGLYQWCPPDASVVAGTSTTVRVAYAGNPVLYDTIEPKLGGGDATLAKQQEILAAIQGSEVIQTPSPNVRGNLVLIQGDTYDGIANPKAQWTVSTDYTDGWSVTLTIRDQSDAVVYTVSGEVVSDTVIAVGIDCPTGLAMDGCPGQWQGKFDVQLRKGGSVGTIALGVCYINEDQTR